MKTKSGKKVGIFLAVSIGLTLALTTILPSAWAQKYKSDEILVKFKSHQEEKAFKALHRKLKVVKAKKLKINKVYHLKLPKGSSVAEAVRTAYSDPNVEYAEPNYILEVNTTPNDPYFNFLYGLHNTGQTEGTADCDIDATESWDIITEVPDNIIIAVIDSGVDYTHQDLAPNMWHNPGEIPNNGIDDDGNGYIDDYYGYDFYSNDPDPKDLNSHGTHCAGIIAAVGNNNIGVSGVCWKAKIMAVQFISSYGYGYTSDAILAIQYAVENGAKILSNSWGGGSYSQALRDAVVESQNAGTLFVVAAGNAGTNNDLYSRYPSSYDLDNIIAVAATEQNDNLAYFSNYGPTSVDLAAPGSDIYSTIPSNGYGYKSGTSMAAPYVSGICALIWTHYPAYSNLRIKARLLATVDQKENLCGKMLSNGRANLYNALTANKENISPSQITDLAVKNVLYSSITITWTAIGDSGSSGKAFSYDIRYSTAEITEKTWNEALKAPGVPAPQPAGTQEKFMIADLVPDTKYYAAIKVVDSAGNLSSLSNVVSTTTNVVSTATNPTSHVVVNPTELPIVILQPNTTATETLTITNTANAPLEFAINSIILFQDDMESGTGKWTSPAPWALVTTESHSPTHSWHDSPGSNYGNNVLTDISLANPIDLSLYSSATLTFWHKYALETDYDCGGIYISTDSWMSFVRLKFYTGFQNTWTQASIDLSDYTGSGNTTIDICFELETDYSVTYDGWYIDDVEIIGSIESADWIKPDPVTGTVIPGESTIITLTYDSTGMNEGSYATKVNIITNDPNNNVIKVPAYLIVETTPPEAPPQISITSPNNGEILNTSTVNVSGTIDCNNSIVTINGVAANVENNTFNATIGLNEGSNTITVKTTNSVGTTTKTITVTLDTILPQITITQPLDGTETDVGSINVSCTVCDNIGISQVTINSKTAEITGNTFTVSGIILNEGKNKITAEAKDTAGNINAVSIIVIYTLLPEIDVSPTVLPDVILNPGETTTKILNMANLGNGELVFTIYVKDTGSIVVETAEYHTIDNTAKNTQSTDAQPPISVRYHPTRLLIKYKDGALTESSIAINEELGAQAIKTYKEIGVQKVELSSGISLKEAIDAYIRSGKVEYAEPDYIVEAQGIPNDPYFQYLWGLHNSSDEDINAPAAWDITTGSSNVVMAIVDSGIDYTHEDLSGNIWINSGEIPDNGVDDDENGYIDDVYGYDFSNDDSDPRDDYGHGTHAAGTIAAVGDNNIGVTGINWQAKVMAVKVLANTGLGYISDAVDGISYAVNNGARVINVSWGGWGYSKTLKDAIDYADSNNALVVCGAGNIGCDTDIFPYYPASYSCSNIISVAALYYYSNYLASWSNYGATTVDLAAPGSYIYSTFPEDIEITWDDGYTDWNGTSMAAHHVTGVAGLILSQNSSLTDEELKTIILGCTESEESLSGKCVTGGRLNAYSCVADGSDVIPPASITDLSVLENDFHSVTISWTAPGDDGNTGKASGYDIRYDIALITEANFDDAIQVVNPPFPKNAGTTETFTIEDIEEDTKYYIAIKTIDNAGNKSSISNVVNTIVPSSNVIFTDDCESGKDKWTADSPWDLVTNEYYSATHSWHDSPGGNYGSNLLIALTSIPFDLSSCSTARLTFRYKHELEVFGHWDSGPCCDYGYLQISTDNGTTWETLKKYNGSAPDWTLESIDLTPYCGASGTNVQIRFLLETDDAINWDGWYIDDVLVRSPIGSSTWLKPSPVYGEVHLNSSIENTLTYSAEGLALGTYYAEINILSNDPDEKLIKIPAKLIVRDTIPSVINITCPTDGTITNADSITVSGIVTDNCGISKVTVNNQPAEVINDTFIAKGIALSEGKNTILAEATDIGGNTSSVSITVIRDTTPPNSPTIDPVTSPTNINTQTIYGTKSSDTIEISVTCTTAIAGIVSYNGNTWSCTLTNLSEGTNNTSVTARDKVGNESLPVTASIILETTIPSKVINLGAVDTPEDNGGSITLTWTHNTEKDLNHYNIYRSTNPITNVSNLNILCATTSNRYRDNTTTDKINYYYAATAVDNFGNEGKEVIDAGPVFSMDNLYY